MSASPPRVQRRWRHHGDRLAGLPTPFIQPERSSFRPGARRRSLLFGCVVLVWPRAGGGVNPQTFAVCDLRYDSVPRITLLTNYPTFCQQGAPAGKGQAEPRRFFRISPNRGPSCRKSSPNAQNMTVRGTSKMRKRHQRVACIAASQENPRSRISDNDACMLKPLPLPRTGIFCTFG